MVTISNADSWEFKDEDKSRNEYEVFLPMSLGFKTALVSNRVNSTIYL